MTVRHELPTEVRSDGRAPRGAWWVALRHNRFLLLTMIGMMLAIGAAMLWHRVSLLHSYAAAGISDVNAVRAQIAAGSHGGWAEAMRALERIDDAYVSSFSALRIAMVLAPAACGCVLGALLFTRDFDRRSQVLTLTQSVGIRRWVLTKLVVALLPLTVGFGGLGLLLRWTADTWGTTVWNPLKLHQLLVFGWAPAIIAVTTFCVGIGITGVLRSPIPALLVTGAIGVGLFVLLVTGYTSLVPSQKNVDPQLSQSIEAPVGALVVMPGFQDAAGNDVIPDYSCPAYQDALAINPQLSVDRIEALRQQCLRSQGITASYLSYLPASCYSRLLWTIAGIGALISAAGLALFSAALRRRVV